MAKLSEICAINMGQSPESSSYNQDGDGLPFFQGNADFGVIHPSVRVWCNKPTKIARSGDVLFSVRAPIGAMNIADRTCCIGRGLASLTVDECLCYKQYFWHALASKTEELISQGTGSTFKAINKAVLADTEIPLPPMEKQKQIAHVLDKVSTLISLRKQQLAKLDELVKARFVEMFGDPVVNTMEWETRAGEALFKLSNGKAVPAQRRLSSGVPAYGGNGISWFTDSSLIDHDTIVVGRVGFQSGNVHYAEGPLWVTDNAMFISKYKQNDCDLRFLYYLMEIMNFTRFQDDGDLKKITQKPFMNAKYILPPLYLQKQFISNVEMYNRYSTLLEFSLRKMKILKKALMQEYFEKKEKIL